MTTTIATDAPNAREAEIDTKLADLWSRANGLRDRLASLRESLHYDLDIRPTYQRRQRVWPHTLDEVVALVEERLPNLQPWDQPTAEKHLASVVETREALAAVRAEAAPLEQLFDAEGWSRFFLVTNANGHIHSSMQCSTCRWDTRFAWLPELSGLTEKDAVEAYGPKLCSVCFPSAPVEWTLGEAKPVDPNRCPGSGTREHDSSGLRYYSPRARCNHCGNVISVTSTGKLRQHKKGDADPVVRS